MAATPNQHGDKPGRRAVLYLRTATWTSEADDAVLDTQRRGLYAYAADAGFSIIATYVDKGISGLTLDRPQIRACMAALRAHDADILMVHDLDRISRRIDDAATCIDELNRLGVSLVTSDGPLDTDFLCKTYRLMRSKPYKRPNKRSGRRFTKADSSTNAPHDKM